MSGIWCCFGPNLSELSSNGSFESFYLMRMKYAMARNGIGVSDALSIAHPMRDIMSFRLFLFAVINDRKVSGINETGIEII